MVSERQMKMAELEDMGLRSPHEHIKNASTCGTILMENQLETGRITPIQKGYRKDSHITG